MTPDQQRDKLDLIMSERDVDRRVASIFDGAVNVVMARFLYTEEEAKMAARAHFNAKPKRKSPRYYSAKDHP